MGAADAPEVPGWIGAERHLTLLEEENDERAEMRITSEGAWTLVEWVKRKPSGTGCDRDFILKSDAGDVLYSTTCNHSRLPSEGSKAAKNDFLVANTKFKSATHCTHDRNR